MEEVLDFVFNRDDDGGMALSGIRAEEEEEVWKVGGGEG